MLLTMATGLTTMITTMMVTTDDNCPKGAAVAVLETEPAAVAEAAEAAEVAAVATARADKNQQRAAKQRRRR